MIPINIERNICVTNDGNSFSFDYYKGYHTVSDNGIRIYSEYKLSVLLTDGLAAVMDNNVYSTMRGDILLLRPEQIHFGRFLRHGLHCYLDFYIPSSFFSSFEQGFQSLLQIFKNDSSDNICLLSPDNSTREMVLAISEELAQIAEQNDGNDIEGLSSDCLYFASLLKLLNICNNIYYKQCNNPHCRKTMAPPLISKAIGYLNENYMEKLDLTDISEVVGCSVTYLTRSFKNHTGKTVHKYITECRLEHSKRMLLMGASVADACYGSGFGDCSNYIKLFHRYNGITPYQYKLQKT